MPTDEPAEPTNAQVLAEVRADRATVDAYRAEVVAFRKETNARFNSIDEYLQTLYRAIMDLRDPPTNGNGQS